MKLSRRQWINFNNKIDVSPGHGPWGDCQVWTASCANKGYGQVRINGKHFIVPRLMWMLYHPDDWGTHSCVLHKCDNPKCVRLDHLWLGTYRENMRDCKQKGRLRIQTHPEESMKGEENPASKLTEVDVKKIRKDSRSQRVIAADYNVSQPLIGMVKRREIWTHVK